VVLDSRCSQRKLVAVHKSHLESGKSRFERYWGGGREARTCQPAPCVNVRGANCWHSWTSHTRCRSKCTDVLSDCVFTVVVAQALTLSCVKQRHLELHHISALTSLTALRLCSLKAQSGLSSSSSSSNPSAGLWDSDSGSEDEGSDDTSDDGLGTASGPDQQSLGTGPFGWEHDAVVQQWLEQRQQQQSSCDPASAAAAEEVNLSKALANLTSLAVLTVHRVPTLLLSSSSSSTGGSGSSDGYSSSSSEMLPDALASLGRLTSLSAPLWLRDTQLPGAWGSWSTSLVSLQVGQEGGVCARGGGEEGGEGGRGRGGGGGEGRGKMGGGEGRGADSLSD
jgi:hypothetical protein